MSDNGHPDGRSSKRATAGASDAGTEPAPLLEVEELVVTYRGQHRSRGRGHRNVVALDGLDLEIWPGESLGVVGESGSGKSTLARAIVGLVRPASGRIRYLGADLTTMDKGRLRDLRRELQMVFQDPYGSVNPRFTVREVVAEPLENYHRRWGRAVLNDHVAELLTRVRMPPDMADRSVVGLSGGQLQRVGIARALALGPRLLVADEPVSALDVSIQARILNLLADLKRSEGISLLFITHNLAVAQFIADRIAVVYAGRVMEIGRAADVIRSPRHPYSKELLAALPGVRTTRSSVPDHVGAAITVGHVGCPYRVRCPDAAEICTAVTPPLEQKESGRFVACHMVPVATSNGDTPERVARLDADANGSPAGRAGATQPRP